VCLKHIDTLLNRTLADVNADGKMDRREFTIAMFLIKRKLQGYELPTTLPLSLLRSSDTATSPPLPPPPSAAAALPYPGPPVASNVIMMPPSGQCFPPCHVSCSTSFYLGFVGGTAAVVLPLFRPSDPALFGSRPLITPYYCRLGDLLCVIFVFF